MSPVIIQNETEPGQRLAVVARDNNVAAIALDGQAALYRAQRDGYIRQLRAKYSWTYQAIATAVGLSYAQVYTICKR